MSIILTWCIYYLMIQRFVCGIWRWFKFWDISLKLEQTRSTWTHYPLGNSPIVLTHWGRVTRICIGKLTDIRSDNGLSPDRRQAIIWTNAGIFLIGPLGTNFCEILIEMFTYTCIWKWRVENGVLDNSSWFCLSLEVASSITTESAIIYWFLCGCGYVFLVPEHQNESSKYV